jgi:hypothetical protein
MSGGVRRDVKRGTWLFVLDVPSVDGRRKQVFRRGFRTKKLAEDELNKIRDNITRGVHIDPSTVTVGEYLTGTWLPALASALRLSTLDTYERLVRAHLLPAFAAIKLQKLERVQIRRWVDELATQMSPKSVRNVHAILNKALNDAVDLNLMARNVAAKITLPHVERGAPRAWSADQLGQFLDVVANDRLYPLWRLVAMTGCRRGEAPRAPVGRCQPRRRHGDDYAPADPRWREGGCRLAQDSSRRSHSGPRWRHSRCPEVVESGTGCRAPSDGSWVAGHQSRVHPCGRPGVVAPGDREVQGDRDIA